MGIEVGGVAESSGESQGPIVAAVPLMLLAMATILMIQLQSFQRLTHGIHRMNTAWTYLLLAGLFEVGWPLGLKISQSPGRFGIGIVAAIACMAISGALLWTAQKSIPMGTAYAVWTGIGAAGTFVVGVAAFGDALGPLRVLSVVLIISGVVGLKLASG